MYKYKNKSWENKLHLKLFQIPVCKQTAALVSLAGGSRAPSAVSSGFSEGTRGPGNQGRSQSPFLLAPTLN